MEIINVSNNVMKISLHTKEAEGLQLNEALDDSLLKECIKKLLKKEKISARGNLIADIFYAKDGGVEIFVSRRRENDSLYKERFVQELPKKIKMNSCAYCFDDFEKLILVAKRLKEVNYYGVSTLYYDENEQNYYIILDDVSEKEIKYVFLMEYSKIVKNFYISHIREHYKCIFKKEAVKKLAKL